MVRGTKERILSSLKANQGRWLSGQFLSDDLKISRTAIWKQVRTLRGEGYVILSSSRKGYQLREVPPRLLPAEIRSGLKTHCFGQGEIVWLEEVDSTNTRAKDLARQGAEEGTLVVAEGQQSGRGRRGRQWYSPSGAGIYVSLILRPRISPSEAPQINILAAVAVAEALLKLTGMDVRVKWPNDIMVGSKKLAGILTEISADLEGVDYLVMGLGLNVTSQGFPPDLCETAGSILSETGRSVSRIGILQEILAGFETLYRRFCVAGLSEIMERYRELGGQPDRQEAGDTVGPDGDLTAFDRKHLWHPYTSLLDPLPVYEVVGAKGVRLHLKDGRTLIDGMSSWWAAVHGYNHPDLNAAAERQIKKMSHVMFGGLTHEPAVSLAAALIDLAPGPLNKVFISDSGSVSVEVAIKMALQYWQARGRPEKQTLLTVRSGYHGDTFGAMAVCDPVNGMHEKFSGVLARHHFADAPSCRYHDEWDDRDIAGFHKIIREHHSGIAAVIMEPIVQGAGGMRFYHPEYLRQVRALTERYDVLLILDEIATGFGRTGTMFGCDQAGVVPDIMCLGKALTGGYMSLAATLAGDKVGDGIAADGRGVFMHGPTFMANPLACAVAKAAIDLLLSSPWRQRVRHIEERLKSGLAPCRDLPGVTDVRVLGAIGVVELDRPVDMAVIQKRFVEKGIWIRPFGRLVYTMPPYIIEDADLDHLTSAIFEVLSEENRRP